MKRTVVYVLVACLCLVACGAALGEAAPESMSAEELYQAGMLAEEAQDYEKAMEYYQLAVDQGHAEALACVGYLYSIGGGVEQSYEKAAEYYRQAAEQGVPGSIDSLKELVEAGYVSEDYLSGLSDQ